MLTEYAEKEWKNESHIGETPVQIIREVRAHGKKAVDAIEKASAHITKNKEEFERVRNDMHIYQALANNFAEKAAAALDVLRYKYSNDIRDLNKAYSHLKASLSSYKQLVDLTKNAYLYANSMQTQQRKIPIGGNDGKNKTWEELLPFYEQELKIFRKHIDSLQSGMKNGATVEKKAFNNASVSLLTPAPVYSVETGKEIFADTATYIKDFAAELKQLNVYAGDSQLRGQTRVDIYQSGPASAKGPDE